LQFEHLLLAELDRTALPREGHDPLKHKLGQMYRYLENDDLAFTPADPPVLCLCPACWLAYAKKWGEAEKKSADVYSPARAKTDKNGVHRQVEDAAFLKNVVVANGNGSPQAEPIVSCIVHEVMHYWSHDHSGVSAHNREKGVEWDEVICDWDRVPGV
ncbi:MAG: hypothetical protein ABSH56_20655, partial [Bryobacteraceae bacterium]